MFLQKESAIELLIDALTKRIFYLIIVDGRQQQGKLFESILNFSHLLIRGLIKGLKMD